MHPVSSPIRLGLSSNLSVHDRPQPYRLWDATPGLFDYVEYSAPLDMDTARAQASLFEEMWRRRGQIPVLFHPVHLNLYGPTLEPRERLEALAHHAEAVGSPWVSNDVGWWHVDETPFPGYLYLPPPLNREGLESCAIHARWVQSFLKVPLVLENPAVMALRGNMHMLDFMSALHHQTGCDLLMDVGHLLSYQLSRGLTLLAGADAFPWERVIELHVAGGVVTPRDNRAFYIDDHTQPVREELFELLEALLARCVRLRAVTFEGDGHPPEQAKRTLRRLRSMIERERGFQPQSHEEPLRLLALDVRGAEPNRPGEARSTSVPLVRGAWDVFEQAYGFAVASEDAEGQEAELDYRLAVLAERLDRTWPLTRLLLLGSREALRRFARSEAFRSLFDGAGRTLPQAFSAYARQAVREQSDEVVASVLAFEMWALGMLREGVAEFPVDFSELQFAARALRRHLTGRAWVSGSLELGSLEGLRQVAARAERKAWKVVLRRTRVGVQVVTDEQPELGKAAEL